MSMAVVLSGFALSLTGCVPESKQTTTPVRQIEEIKIHVGPPQIEQDQKTEEESEQ